MKTYIPKICSTFLLTNRCSNSNIQLCKQMFVTSVRGIYNTDLQLMIQGGTVMRNENNTITGRTCQMSGNTSSRVHSGDVSRNRRIVVRRQKIALVSVAFIALAIIICTFLYRDMNAYIDEVCSINKISQNEIHAGQYLTIPYYSSIAIAGK